MNPEQETSISQTSQISEKLDRVIAFLQFSNLRQLREIMPKILDTAAKTLIYSACDGNRGINEISRITGVNAMTVSSNVKKFEQFGIVISKSTGNKKFPIKLVELEIVGMQIPTQKISVKNDPEGDEPNAISE